MSNESLEYLYHREIANEKRKRKAAEAALENEKKENENLRAEIDYQKEVNEACMHTVFAAARVCVSIAAAAAAFKLIRKKLK